MVTIHKQVVILIKLPNVLLPIVMKSLATVISPAAHVLRHLMYDMLHVLYSRLLLQGICYLGC